MRIAYVDMIGGVSGDMLLGALVDAGLSPDVLREELDKLDSHGFELAFEKVKRGGIEATLVRVELDSAGERVRDWGEFEAVIRGSSLSTTVKERALRVFDALADAESAAHGVSKEQTHLHELGTVDTLVDIVGVVAGFEMLGVSRVHASPFPLSSGVSRSSHGVMAATAAATAAIYQKSGAPVRGGGSNSPQGEAVTPTGAAIITTIARFDPVSIIPQVTGYGAGNRNPESYPNVAGIWLGDDGETANGDLLLEGGVVLLETNIDDMTGEAIGYLQERLMKAGVLDAWTTPIQMKKSRPAVLLSVLCRSTDEPGLVRLVLTESSTLGLRRRAIERYVAEREIIRVSVYGHDIGVKVKKLSGRIAGVHPEYEDCRTAASETGLPMRDIADAATAAARVQLAQQL